MMHRTLSGFSAPPHSRENVHATDDDSIELGIPKGQPCDGLQFPASAMSEAVMSQTAVVSLETLVAAPGLPGAVTPSITGDPEAVKAESEHSDVGRRTCKRTIADRLSLERDGQRREEDGTGASELEAQEEITVAGGGLRLRLNLKRSEPSKPWPDWAVRLVDGEGFSIQIDTINEKSVSQLAGILNQPASPNYFASVKSMQDSAATSIMQLDQTQPDGRQLTSGSDEPLNAFAAYQTEATRNGLGSIGDWSQQLGASVAEHRQAATMNPWQPTPGRTTGDPNQAGQNAWNMAAEADGAGQETEETVAAANGCPQTQALSPAPAHLVGSSAEQQAVAAQQMFQMPGYMSMQQLGRAGPGAMMPGAAPGYVQYPQLLPYASPMVNAFMLHQRGLMMSGGMGLDRGLGSKRRFKHGFDDGFYENSEERTFSQADKDKLREAPWPDKKRPTGLPTLYCHLCYLKEGVFRVVSAISPNPDTVYFRHQQCHTSFKRGEDLPKRIVTQYQVWYKKRALAQQASRGEMGGYGRGSNVQIESADI